MRILIIDDDIALCKALGISLAAEGIQADLCHSGDEGIYYLKQDIYDMCVLDRMLPVCDGLCVLQEARALGISTPILMLTALSRIQDKVDGFAQGADDYLVKPFDTRELIARIRALARRSAQPVNEALLQYADIALNTNQLILSCKDESLTISIKECELLEAFIKSPNTLLPRNILLGRVWGADATIEESCLDSYIHFVRRRLSCVHSLCTIVTVRGMGYRLEAHND